MQTGIVKWFNETKGYGFILSEGTEYFVHYKSINQDGYKTLPEGAKVEFTAEKGRRGMEARGIRIV